MSELRLEELRAKVLIAQALGRRVCQHDNGSSDLMYDLRVGPAEDPEIVIEINGIRNQERLSTEATIDRTDSKVQVPGLRFSWFVLVRSTARIKALPLCLGQWLPAIEEQMSTSRWDARTSMAAIVARDRLKRCGVMSIQQSTTSSDGELVTVRVGLPATPEPINRDGNEVVDWLDGLIRPEREDWRNVLRKLDVPTARERHLYLPIGVDASPHKVESYFFGADLGPGSPTAPSRPPKLPAPITHVWLESDTSNTGWRWTGSEWASFSTIVREAGPDVGSAEASRPSKAGPAGPDSESD